VITTTTKPRTALLHAKKNAKPALSQSGDPRPRDESHMSKLWKSPRFGINLATGMACFLENERLFGKAAVVITPSARYEICIRTALFLPNGFDIFDTAEKSGVGEQF